MDVMLLEWINVNFSNPIVLSIFYGITRLGDLGFIWLIGASYLKFIKKQPKQAYLVLISLIITTIIVELLLKEVVQRPRPFITHEMIESYFISPSGYSFPSGHAASSFAASVMLYLTKYKYSKLALVLASLIAFSRLVLQVHYPSDVLFGMIVGSSVAYLVYWGYKKYRK